MKTLFTFLTLISLIMPLTGMSQIAQNLLVSAAEEKPAKPVAGYFFSLKDVPLSQKQYIFRADPLKKAVLMDGDKNVILSHTMTVKSARGFDMYFSAGQYNVTLALKDAQEMDGGTTEYKGTLFVKRGSEKHKYAVHGFQNH
ncbi:hypothetical protein SAMN05216327_102410 [Dyadobacter sp. SG02]|uniref:hypothetical protein n=1 Tax=Dyadobacter sp. SG02 TaxID=1855291 RepID=UPI0008B6F8A4|nr:hypothetical protein [Dyadobacter sp. SG02]SEI55210.1 hypothetical protein SAMN05216327_102410 [Dyadobacter sp. SG02]